MADHEEIEVCGIVTAGESRGRRVPATPGRLPAPIGGIFRLIQPATTIDATATGATTAATIPNHHSEDAYTFSLLRLIFRVESFDTVTVFPTLKVGTATNPDAFMVSQQLAGSPAALDSSKWKWDYEVPRFSPVLDPGDNIVVTVDTAATATDLTLKLHAFGYSF